MEAQGLAASRIRLAPGVASPLDVISEEGFGLGESRPGVRFIASSDYAVRVACEVCGTHRVVAKGQLGPFVVCSPCAAARVVNDRRKSDLGHAPERRATRSAV